MNQVADDLKSSGQAVSIAGWLCAILGVLAIVFPFAAGTGVTLAVGIALLLAGISRTSDGWKHRERDGLTQLVLGLLTAVAGLVCMLEPWFGLKMLTMVLIVYFLLSGVLTLIAVFKYRSHDGFWFLADGVATLLLGVLLCTQFPVSALWLIGLLVGIRLLFMGVVMIVTGKAVREVAGLVE